MSAEQALIERLGIGIRVVDIQEDGLSLRYAITGSGPSLLLLHGLNIGWGQWYAMIPELTKRYTVYALDFPGAGGSSRIDFEARQTPDILIRALDIALRKILPDPPIIVAHSIGAWVALKHCVRNPGGMKSLVAIDALGFTSYLPLQFWPVSIGAVARTLAKTAVAPNRKNLDAFLVSVTRTQESIWAEYFAYVHEHVNKVPTQHPLLLIKRLSRPFRIREEFVFSDAELAALANKHILFLHGALDPLLPPARVSEGYSKVIGAGVAFLDGVGHVPPIERPQQTLSAIAAFLKSA